MRLTLEPLWLKYSLVSTERGSRRWGGGQVGRDYWANMSGKWEQIWGICQVWHFRPGTEPPTASVRFFFLSVFSSSLLLLWKSAGLWRLDVFKRFNSREAACQNPCLVLEGLTILPRSQPKALARKSERMRNRNAACGVVICWGGVRDLLVSSVRNPISSYLHPRDRLIIPHPPPTLDWEEEEVLKCSEAPWWIHQDGGRSC